MKVLLDTHVFIWMDTDSTQLSPTALAYFANPSCEMMLSVASVWEMVIKTGTGKLVLSAGVDQVIRDIQAKNPLRLLPVELAHVLAVGNLPDVHRDPFDRILAAQAITEGAVLLTADAVFQQYPVRIDW